MQKHVFIVLFLVIFRILADGQSKDPLERVVYISEKRPTGVRAAESKVSRNKELLLQPGDAGLFCVI